MYRTLTCASLAIALASGAFAADKTAELRVCADPNNFPFSNEQQEGFENKIAQVVANDLGASVTYTWHPQRRGFIRETLKADRCDLVISVPTGYGLVLNTKPYYRSTYVFVYAKNKSLDVRSFDDPALAKVTIGVHAFGDDGANSPPVHALASRGIVRNVVGFPIYISDDSPPGMIIDAVAAGKIDVAIVWGPFGGYFAKRQHLALQVAPILPSKDKVSQPFTFDISMGVRPGDKALQQKVEAVLTRRRADILKILQDYGVPLVGDAPGSPASSALAADAARSAKQ